MIRNVEEARVDMITDLLNQIVAKGVNLLELELSVVGNYYKGKEKQGTEINRSDSKDSWESYWEVDMTFDEMQFGFMYGCWITRLLLFCFILFWDSYTKKYGEENKNLYFAFFRFRKSVWPNV